MRADLRWIALLCLGASACVVVPPGRAEVAAVGRGGDLGYRVAAGGHSASAPRRIDVPFDVGAGYVLERVGDRAQHGSYLELGAPVWRRGRVRLFAGGRGELFWNHAGPAGTVRAASVRLSLERVLGHVSAAAGDRDGGAALFGVLAPGLYVDVGVRELGDGRAAGALLAGLQLRLPLIVAAARPTTLW
jgi:hypothetical protein